MEIKGSRASKSMINPITKIGTSDGSDHQEIGLVQPSFDFGILFSHSRKKKKVTIEQASEELCIKKHQLIAIEEEQFESLPYYIFARGFVMTYAEYLGLNGSEIAQKFDTIYPDELKVVKGTPYNALNTSIERFNGEDEKSLRFNPILLIAFIAVLALAVFLSKKVSSAENEHNKPVPIEEGISKIEQRQGAVLED